MNTTEKRFEDKLIGALRDAGFFCIHPNIMNQGGFPDILAIHDGKVALIEVKIADKMESFIHKSFQATQLPFYINFYKSGGGDCLWIAFDHYGTGHLVKLDYGLLREWKELTWNTLIEESMEHFTGPVWILATALRSQVIRDE